MTQSSWSLFTHICKPHVGGRRIKRSAQRPRVTVLARAQQHGPHCALCASAPGHRGLGPVRRLRVPVPAVPRLQRRRVGEPEPAGLQLPVSPWAGSGGREEHLQQERGLGPTVELRLHAHAAEPRGAHGMLVGGDQQSRNGVVPDVLQQRAGGRLPEPLLRVRAGPGVAVLLLSLQQEMSLRLLADHRIPRPLWGGNGHDFLQLRLLHARRNHHVLGSGKGPPVEVHNVPHDGL